MLYVLLLLDINIKAPATKTAIIAATSSHIIIGMYH
jgi:hypothetical protein